jgi:WXG100 family type VII secretion target
MSSPGAGSLTPDFDLMRDVAAKIDGRNGEIREMLQGFIGRMSSVPPSVWGGNAATAFKGVVDRWNTESVKLNHALQGIAETIRANERVLREAGESHSQQLGAIAQNL